MVFRNYPESQQGQGLTPEQSAQLTANTEQVAANAAQVASNTEQVTAATEQVSANADAIGRVVQYGEKDAPIVIVIGQSNADGRGSLAELGLLASYPEADFTGGEARIFDKPVTRDPNNASVNRNFDGQWVDYTVGDMTLFNGAFGVEYQYAKLWKEQQFSKHGRPLHIIKCGVGGTGLAAHNSPDESWDDSDDSLRNLTTEYMVIPAIRELMLEGLKPKILAITWVQGEKDTQDSADAAAYKDNLIAFINGFREDIGFPDALFQVVQLSNLYSTDADWLQVRSAQAEAVEETDNTQLVNVDGEDGTTPALRYASDSIGEGLIHYSAAGTMNIGAKCYSRFDLTGTDYDKAVDFEFYVAQLPTSGNLDVPEIENTAPSKGTLAIVRYPVSGTSSTSPLTENVLTWARDGGIPNVSNGTSTHPFLGFKIDVPDHRNIEVIYKIIATTSGSSKPSVMVRTNVPDDGRIGTEGALAQLRTGGREMRTYFRNGNSWITGTTLSLPTNQRPTSSIPYFYRVTAIDDTFSMYHGPDLNNLTLRVQDNIPAGTADRGNHVWFASYNGGNGRTPNYSDSLRFAFWGIQAILIRRLD